MPPFREEWGLSDGYSAYWRIVGGAEAIMEKAQAIGQAWMKGIGYARWLEKLS
ncbi:MAG: hypothetical protein U1F26_16745 [Lysobacterales bacterium]